MWPFGNNSLSCFSEKKKSRIVELETLKKANNVVLKTRHLFFTEGQHMHKSFSYCPIKIFLQHLGFGCFSFKMGVYAHILSCLLIQLYSKRRKYEYSHMAIVSDEFPYC